MKRLKGVRFFTTLAVISACALCLSLFPGSFTIQWLDAHITMPIAFLFCGVFVLFAVILLFHNFYFWVRSIPAKSNQYLKRKKEQKIEDLVVEGFAAVAAQEYGDADLISSLILKLDEKHGLGLILKSHANFLKGDFTKAHMIFAKMSDSPSLRFLSLRGLALMALERRDLDHLGSILKQMYEIRPHSPWVLNNLTQYYLHKAQTDSSLKFVPDLPFYLHLSKKDAEAQQGLLIWIKLNNPHHQNMDVQTRLNLLKKAHELLQDNPVITQAYALQQHRCGHRIRAMRTLMRGYKKAPHRLLLESYLELSPARSELDRYKKINKFCASQSMHEESCYLMAKAAFDAKMWGQARHHLTPILSNDPCQEICLLMAQIESCEYPEDKNRAFIWQEKSLTASCFQWQCQHCHHTFPSYDVVCQSCGHFSTISWTKNSPNKRSVLTVQHDYLDPG